MRTMRSCLFLLCAELFTLLAPKTLLAEIIYVVTAASQCPSGTPTPPCYTNLGDAITNAITGVDSIEIHPGTYTGNFTLDKNVSIYGTETARTFLSGGGSGAVLTITGATSALTVRNLAFRSAATGILVQNSSAIITISNNIFEVGVNGAAVQTVTSPSTQIINNVFYTNATGVQSDTNNINIINNIFSNNATAIVSNVAVTGIKNNAFFKNTSIGPTGIVFDSTDTVNWLGNVKDQDPLFADLTQTDITALDFHLQSGSPCINKGNTAGGANSVNVNSKAEPDMGAYGGSNADKVPFPISGLLVTGVTTTLPATASITWNANKSYMVGGYFVYYGTAKGTYGTPLDTLSTAASYDVLGLVSNVSSAPTGTPIVTDTVEYKTINLDWSGSVISGATGYEIRYDTTYPVTPPPTAPAATTVTIDAGNRTDYSIGNLDNGITYHFLVTPYARTIYYIAVKAYNGTDKTILSSVFSNEEDASLDDQMYGASGEKSDYPEAITPYPDLQNNGCFIATAAYGFYSAPQVRALRLFRDRYLLTNALGRSFVRWYYRYGPIGAEFINTHPWLKPLVRLSLLPAVGGAIVMTETPFPAKLMALLFFGYLTIFLIWRKRMSRCGGAR